MPLIPVPPYVYPVKASGGLFAGVEDIARFVCAGMTGSYYADHTLLGPEGIRKLYTPEVDIPGLFGLVSDSYGFGHFIENLSDGRQAVWYGGGLGHGCDCRISVECRPALPFCVIDISRYRRLGRGFVFCFGGHYGPVGIVASC